MNSPQIYIGIAIIALAIIAVVLFAVRGRKPGRRLSKLGALALFLVIAGVIFGENRLTGYGLMVIGGILALIDIIRKRKESSP